jgi:hypothetical protein
MDETDFEGSLILEKLAQVDKLEDFYEAVDADDFHRVVSLLRSAELDEEEISMVLKLMESDS